MVHVIPSPKTQDSSGRDVSVDNGWSFLRRWNIVYLLPVCKMTVGKVLRRSLSPILLDSFRFELTETNHVQAHSCCVPLPRTLRGRESPPGEVPTSTLYSTLPNVNAWELGTWGAVPRRDETSRGDGGHIYGNSGMSTYCLLSLDYWIGIFCIILILYMPSDCASKNRVFNKAMIMIMRPSHNGERVPPCIAYGIP